MDRIIRLLTLAAVMLLSCISASAQWTTVGKGIEYQKYELPTPNNVYVARMLRKDASANMESSLPQGKLTGAKETIKLQSERLNDAINWWGRSWGKRNKVVVAVNGDWTYLNNGMMYGGQVHSGWYCKRIYCEFGGSQFAWTNGKIPYIGACIGSATQDLTITFKAAKASQAADGINRARAENELVIYTPQYDSDTNTDDSGVEVLVELPQPLGIKPLPGMTKGYIRKIIKDKGSTPIPFDHVVLSASGSAAKALLANAKVGAEIGISAAVKVNEQPECATPVNFNWADTYTSISGGHVVLRGGAVVDNSYDKVQANRNPRTAVAYNGTYMYFVVCDGRSKESLGMTGVELATFCKDELHASDALNLDGGGSSTMVVNGKVVNVPSDGNERKVGNGLMMVNLQPKMRSSALKSGQSVKVAESCSVHLGPGANYASLAEVPAGTAGKISLHSLNGIYATGDYWWKAEFGGTVGWVRQPAIAKR